MVCSSKLVERSPVGLRLFHSCRLSSTFSLVLSLLGRFHKECEPRTSPDLCTDDLLMIRLLLPPSSDRKSRAYASTWKLGLDIRGRGSSLPLSHGEGEPPEYRQ